MTKDELMVLADAYADACAKSEWQGDQGWDRKSIAAAFKAYSEAGTALVAALDAADAENAALKSEIQNQYKCIESHAKVTQAAEVDVARIDFQQNNLAYEFTAEDADGELVWVAYKVTGSRNGRKWYKAAKGRTLREAIDAAIAAGGTK